MSKPAGGCFVPKIEWAFGLFFRKPLQRWQVERSGDTALFKALLPDGTWRWFWYDGGKFTEVPAN